MSTSKQESKEAKRLKRRQYKLAQQLRRLGFHHTIIADLVGRDPRPVSDVIEADGLTHLTLPSAQDTLAPEITSQITRHLTQGAIAKLTVPRNLPIDPTTILNLFYRTVLQQREFVLAKQAS